MSIFGELDGIMGSRDSAQVDRENEHDLFSPASQHWDDRITSLDGATLTPVGAPAHQEEE
jgi:hypothetical protein